MLEYLTDRDYQVLADWSDDAEPDRPGDGRLAGGRRRQVDRPPPPRAGPVEFDGRHKFKMPNDFGIYLHDVPDASKARPFTKDNRWISNGCIRLEDADRFAKWLFGHVPKGEDLKAEENVDLPDPVPVYVTYLTAEAGHDGPKFRADPYNRDPALLARYFGEGKQQVAAISD